MSVTYKSNSSSVVNAAGYVITPVPGVQLDDAEPKLDKLVGVSLTREASTALDLLSSASEVTSAVPVIVPSSSTVGVDGSITVTALPTTYAGAWIYLPVDAIVDGAAGLYWAVFSSTTEGTVYTNYVNPASTDFLPYIPTGTLTPAVGSDSSYTTTTGGDIVLANLVIPANTFNTGDVIKMFSRVTCNNSANDKIVKHYMGSSNVLGSMLFTTSTGGSLSTAVFNRGNDVQVAGSFGDTGIAATTYPAIDMSAASKLFISGQLETATDHLILESFSIIK